MTSFAVAGDPAVLDGPEGAALDAVLAVVLPSTSGAGAAEAEVGRYVRTRLAGPDADWLVLLRRWLTADVLGRTGGATAGPDGALADQRAAAAVAALAAEADGPWPGLFEQIRLWAWSGYLCDPGRGGNVGAVGWQRFDWAPPAGRTHTAGVRR